MNMSMPFKRTAVALLSSILALSGCSPQATLTNDSASIAEQAVSTDTATEISEFTGLDDPELHDYLEDSIYQELLDTLDMDEYCIDNIEVTYVSQEYLDELNYNSQANLYFGYTLSELDQQFQGARYVFTVDDSTGKTVVEQFENYDDTYVQALQNVAIGTGVILVCVTISAVTGGAGMPAACAIFATSAKTAAIMGASAGVLSGAVSGAFTALETGDMDKALKNAALDGSEAFKWGAIVGAVTGGAGEAIALKGATAGGLSMNEVALIQKESGYSLSVIKQLANADQYEILKLANEKCIEINGVKYLVQEIDLEYVDELGRTNLERMLGGLAPLDPATGKAYELHHMGQLSDGILTVLKQEEHRGKGNYSIWHLLEESTVEHGAEWNQIREDFWIQFAQTLI